MAERAGHTYVARALKDAGVDTLFYLMGGPIIQSAGASAREGIRTIDVRHEQAAAMMAHAYARVTGKPGVCMAASGPAVTNLITGVANAWMDRAPLVVLGGASPVNAWGRGGFQEIDQVALMRPVTKWAERVTEARRIPELLATAFRIAQSDQPGPVYLDLPGDVLFSRAEEELILMPNPSQYARPSRALGDPALIEEAIKLLAQAERPILLTGSGLIWSGAGEALRAFAEAVGVPLYTTPLGRGALPEDHPLASAIAARSRAFREADCVLVIGTRLNFIVSEGQPPRFAPGARFIRVDTEASELGRNRALDVGILGDAKLVLGQLSEAAQGRIEPARWAAWRERLQEIHNQKQAEQQTNYSSDQVPIHTQRLMAELRDVLPRDAILAVDGHDTLNFARQTIPTHVLGHRLNPGVSGCMGVGIPFGIGAKAAKPDSPVVILTGDGSFGFNGFELDTALRHNLPVTVVVPHNGGWTGAVKDYKVPGRDLRFTHYEKIVEDLGGKGEWVERPEQIRPALERALSSNTVYCVVVAVDPYVRSETMPFGGY